MTEVFEKLKANALEDWYDLNSSKWVRIGGGTSGQAMGSYEIFNQAKKIAWAQISQDEDVMELIAKEKEYTKRKYNASQGTINEMINMRK